MSRNRLPIDTANIIYAKLISNMTSLVIVESPTKARTIGKYLGKDFVIKASMGHVVDLPKSTLAIDIEHDFKPLYEQVLDKKQIIADLNRVYADEWLAHFYFLHDQAVK